MKFRLTFKCPEVCDQLDQLDLDKSPEYEDICDLLTEFIQYEENVTIEFDTNERTAVVVPAHT